MAPPIPKIRPTLSTHPVIRAVGVAALLFVFLMGVKGLGDAFDALGGGLIDSFFAATRNPFMGLMVGILATTLVQSSSVTTAMIVGFVGASVNPLPIANAVPMVMGANIGTTVTNTIVSMAHMGRKQEFYRAFSVATCHDFFNYLAVLILLPLEMATGYLQRMAMAISSTLTGLGGMEYDSPIKGALKAALTPIKGAISAVTDSERIQAVILILVSAALIYVALMLLVRVMRSAMRSRVEVIVSRGLHKAPAIGILVGILVTTMVQSSSITTSLLVPLAGAGIITLVQAFPITIGANIGTTVTALLAALAATGPNARLGITIALVHLLFNISATLLIYPTARVRNIPLTAARRLAAVAIRSRRWAFLYVVLLFYGVPALFAVLNRFLG
ncbi:MAG: Na/Pi symporter [Gemmatimonadales bacterium]|jgi:sodium-dependent phosphate cotransporter